MNDWILITRLSETSWISVIRNKDGWSSSILAQYVTPMSIGTHRRNSYITPPPVLTALLITRSSKKTRTTRKATVQDVRQDTAQQNYLRKHGAIKWSWELRTCRFMFWHSALRLNDTFLLSIQGHNIGNSHLLHYWPVSKCSKPQIYPNRI